MLRHCMVMPLTDEQFWLQRLAAFAPILRDPNTVFGTWHPNSGTGTHADPWNSAGTNSASPVGDFYQLIADADWASLVRNWSDWIESPDGQLLADNRDALTTASYDQLARLLGALIRRQRWDEETWKSAYESGLLLAVAERAETILSTDQ